MSKLKVDTLYVPLDNYNEAREVLSHEDINIIPLGIERELIEDIKVYLISNRDSPLTDEGESTKESKRETTTRPLFEKLYMNEEHKLRSEGKL